MRTMMISTRRSGGLIAAAAIAAMATSAVAATAHADTTVAPPPESNKLSTQILPGVQYTSDITDGSAVFDTPFGKLTTKGAQFQVQDSAGKTVVGAPLHADAAKPVPAAVPTPVMTATAASVDRPAAVPARPAVTPVSAQDDRVNQALGVAGGKFALGVGVGAMTGGLTGLGIGCVAGAVTGGTLFIPVSLGTLSLPAALAGCAAGAALGSGLGATIGGAVVGIPVGIAAAQEFFNTINAPLPAPAAHPGTSPTA